jgi:PAS domain S-box-containing protein
VTTLKVSSQIQKAKRVKRSVRSNKDRLPRAVKATSDIRLLTSILETLPVIVFAKQIDAGFRFVLWNRQAEQLTGIKSQDCIGKTDYDLFPQSEADFFRSKDVEASKGQGIVSVEEESVTSPTGTRLLRTHKVLVRDERNQPAYLLGVSEDVTEARRALQDLENTRNKLSLILSLVPASIFQTDENGNCIYINERWTKMTGYTMEQALGTGWASFIHPEDRERTWTVWQQAFEQQAQFDLTYRFISKSGKHVWASVHSEPVLDSKGSLTGYMGTIQDVTENVQAIKQRDEAAEENNAFFMKSPHLKVISGLDGICKRANTAFAKTLGYSPEGIVGFHFSALIHADDLAQAREEYASLNDGQVLTTEHRWICKDGSVKVLSWTVFPDLVAGRVYSTAIDVTETRQKEFDAKTVMDALNRHAIVAVTDKRGQILEVNDRFCKISGFSREELLGKDHRLVNSGAHPQAYFKNLWATISSGNVWTGEIQNRTKLGLPYFVQTIISPLYGVDGRISRYMAIRFDVTKQKDTERLLEEAQRVAGIGSWSYDLRTREILWSRQMFYLFAEDAAVGAPSFERQYDLIHPEDREQWRSQVNNSILNGDPLTTRFRILLPGKTVWIEAHGEAKRSVTGEITGLSGTCQDISKLVDSEEKLRAERVRALQNAKLASLGEMSAGVAHEINNPLAIINGTVRLLAKHVGDPQKFSAKIDAIERATDRINRIVSGLRKFSRSSDRQTPKEHQLDQIVLESMVLTEAKARRHDVRIYLCCERSLKILCNEIEIEQTLVNLLNNAIDAVQDGKVKWVHIHVFEGDSDVVLQIRDSGQGIAKEVQTKLFQPFFTTKEVGEGTGLGLSIVKGILDEHGASIELLAEANTCFEIRFKSTKPQPTVVG